MKGKLSYSPKPIQIGAVGLIGNIFLSILKLSGGIISRCDTLISDGIHSAADILGNIVVICGLLLSSNKGKEKTKFDRKKFEYMASGIIGVFLLFTGLIIGISAIIDITKGDFKGARAPEPLSLIIALVALAVKFFLFRFTLFYGKKYNSKALLADGYHHQSDVFSTSGALIGVLFSQLGFPVMDKVASLIICILITKTAYDILKDSFGEMKKRKGV